MSAWASFGWAMLGVLGWSAITFAFCAVVAAIEIVHVDHEEERRP